MRENSEGDSHIPSGESEGCSGRLGIEAHHHARHNTFMSTPVINTTIALKLHAFGLMKLHDPNWTGMEMFEHLKNHIKGYVQPEDLLRKTLREGLLHFLGQWLFEDYFFDDLYVMNLGGEYRLWYLEDLIELLESSGVAQDDLITRAKTLVEKVSELYSQNENEYWKVLDADDGPYPVYRTIRALIESNEGILRDVMPMYATNYAERVFHDRQLCEHISKTLITIGFDGTNDGGEPRQWVERAAWPSWAIKTVTARDRGKCAECGVDITMELTADPHIDHIIPLAKGGTNDLVNLQLLCQSCNLKKLASLIDVRSSVPEYLKQHRASKRKLKDA
jgi:hypothetical protein